jgi:hypothetical protein
MVAAVGLCGVAASMTNMNGYVSINKCPLFAAPSSGP